MLIGYAAQVTVLIQACSQSGCLIALLHRKRQVCCTLPGQKRSRVLQLAKQCQTVSLDLTISS